MAVLTTEGKEWIIDKVQDVAPISNAKMDIGLTGTGGAAEADANTVASFTEVSEARVSGALSQPTTRTDRLIFTYAYAGTKTVTEAGRTNTITKGHASEKLLCRALFTGIPVVNGDQIEITFDHTQ